MKSFITSSFHNVNNFYSLRQHALYNAVDRLSFSLIDACKKRSEKGLLDVFISCRLILLRGVYNG